MSLLKMLFIFLGTLTLVIGVIGIFVPGLPTTPFLLLTAGLYLRSSDRLYSKILANRYIGNYIYEFQKSKSITIRSKIYSIALMWAMIIISANYFIPKIAWQIVLLILGVIGTVVMGLIIKTRKEK
jgi:uncharacterized membrane protein YbaN (DUF454 family)